MRLGILMALASPWSRDIALRIADAGHAVHVIDATRDEGDSYVRTDDEFQRAELAAFERRVARVTCLGARLGGPASLRYLALTPALRRYARTHRLDALFTLYGGGQALLAWGSGVRPYGVYVVGSDVLRAGRAARAIARHTLAGADLVLANGRYLAERARRLAPRAAVDSLLFGVDTHRFHPGGAPRLDRPVEIVCTRGFLPVYNNEQIVRALALLPDDLPEYRVTFVSPGPLLEGTKRIADRILSPEARRRVTFAGGMSADALLARLRDADIFVSVSRSDGTATSLLEALACGLYVVLSDIPANRDWVDGSETGGRLVRLDDDADTATALADAIREPERRLRARAANRALAERWADAERNGAELIGRLEAMAANGGTR